MAVEQRDRVDLEHLGDLTKEAVTDGVSGHRHVVIGRVVARHDPGLGAHRHRVGSREVDDRAVGPTHPRRSAGQAGATEEVEQHRLGSIIRGVRHTNVVGQRVIPEAACRGLEVRGGVEVEASVLERHPPRSCEIAHERGIVGRRGADTVIDVPDRERTPGRAGEHGHGDTVGAATDAEVKVPVREAAATEQLRNDHRIRRRAPKRRPARSTATDRGSRRSTGRWPARPTPCRGAPCRRVPRPTG